MKKTKKARKVSAPRAAKKPVSFWKREVDTSLGVVVLLSAFLGAYWFIDYLTKLSEILQMAHVYAY